MTTSLSSQSPYVPTSIVLPTDYAELIIRLRDIITTIFLSLNQREIALYSTAETVTGEVWPSDDTTNLNNTRTTFRRIYLFGTINAGASLTIATNIDFLNTFTNMYGTANTATPDIRPIPYADVTNVTNQISLTQNGANIVIANGATAPVINSGIIVLEYLKN